MTTDADQGVSNPVGRPSDKIYMNVKEFRTLGYLQEVNRCFLHPLGLALEVEVKENGSEVFSGIWDERQDPEGIMFDKVDEDKTLFVVAERMNRMEARKELFGGIHWIQPFDSDMTKPVPEEAPTA